MTTGRNDLVAKLLSTRQALPNVVAPDGPLAAGHVLYLSGLAVDAPDEIEWWVIAIDAGRARMIPVDDLNLLDRNDFRLDTEVMGKITVRPGFEVEVSIASLPDYRAVAEIDPAQFEIVSEDVAEDPSVDPEYRAHVRRLRSMQHELRSRDDNVVPLGPRRRRRWTAALLAVAAVVLAIALVPRRPPDDLRLKGSQVGLASRVLIADGDTTVQWRVGASAHVNSVSVAVEATPTAEGTLELWVVEPSRSPERVLSGHVLGGRTYALRESNGWNWQPRESRRSQSLIKITGRGHARVAIVWLESGDFDAAIIMKLEPGPVHSFSDGRTLVSIAEIELTGAASGH